MVARLAEISGLLFFITVVPFFVVILWRLFSHPRHMFRTRRYLEITCFFIHVFWVVCLLGSSLYFLNCWIGGLYMLTNFSLSHTHKPVVQPNEHRKWLEYASKYTTNIEPSWWCDWWMGYLNYQIEHHLFPTMPQFRQRSISPRVKSLFEKHGLTYDIKSYWQALETTVRNLDEVGQVVSTTKE